MSTLYEHQQLRLRAFPLLLAECGYEELCDAIAEYCKFQWSRWDLKAGWHRFEDSLQITIAGRTETFSYLFEPYRTMFYYSRKMKVDLSQKLNCRVFCVNWGVESPLLPNNHLEFLLADQGELQRLVISESDPARTVSIGVPLVTEAEYPLLPTNPLAIDKALESHGFPLKIFSQDFMGLDDDFVVGWEGDIRDMLFQPSVIDQEVKSLFERLPPEKITEADLDPKQLNFKLNARQLTESEWNARENAVFHPSRHPKKKH